MASPYNWLRERIGKKRKKVETVNFFFGFFLIINYCFGTGFLAIPYAFFYAGYLAAIPTLLFITFISWLNANYLLEIMARAQALEYLKGRSRTPSEGSEDLADNDEAESKESSAALLSQEQPVSTSKHPRFEISQLRKFEVSELCQIFFNKYLKYAYLIVLSLHNFLSRWSFAAVAGSAWAVNIPFHKIGAVEICEEDAFLHNMLPAENPSCLHAYYVSLTIFAVIVVPLSLFDLKEQAIIQFILGALRFVVIFSMIIYSIVQLGEGGDACIDRLDADYENLTDPFNVKVTSEFFKVDIRGLLQAIPIFTYGYLFHTGLSSLTHPIKPKKHLHHLVICVFVVAMLTYLLVGIFVAMWFRASIQETSTLNWALFTHPGNTAALRALSYSIVLFPSIDVISAYPLSNHVLVNNLYIFITGHDTTKKPKYRFDWFLRLVLRIISALLPIAAAFGVANLVQVLKYAGLFGFACIGFPIILQLKSTYDCREKFLRPGAKEEPKPSSSADLPDDEKLGSAHESFHLSEQREPDNEGSSDDKRKPSLTSQLREFLLPNMADKEVERSYMTPYSSILFSYPMFVVVVGIIGLIVLVLVCLSLVLHPDLLNCLTLLNLKLESEL